jgi:hypothetical protein
MMTEEELIDELERVTIEWALEEEPTGTTAEVTDTAGGAPDRAFMGIRLRVEGGSVKASGLQGEGLGTPYGMSSPTSIMMVW